MKLKQVNPFKTRNYMKIQDIGLFFQFQKKIPLNNCVDIGQDIGLFFQFQKKIPLDNCVFR